MEKSLTALPDSVSSKRKPSATSLVIDATISMIEVAAKTLKRILPAFNGVSDLFN